MERITYRKTLDVHKNGTQFLLQGFQTADNMSRVIEISLMASGNSIDFPLERLVAVMYVTSPGAKEPSINKCTIEDNKVVYEVLPITTEGITKMQLKLIESSPEGAKSVLASPEFAVEVTDSGMNDEGEELKTTFTAFEKAKADAKIAYDERFLRMELSSDCMFRAFYADGSVYETDVLKRLFLNGNVELSASFAHGGTGVRAGENTDNSMYYSNVSKSEALNAKSIMEDSEEVLEEVKLHGVYTAFSVDFTTGEVEYVSPSFEFNINRETGEIEAKGQTYTFNEEIYRVVEEWLAKNGVLLKDLANIATSHAKNIEDINLEIIKINENIKLENSKIYTEIDDTNKEIARVGDYASSIEKMLKGDKLWVNPNPEAVFEAQTISLDLTEYKRFEVFVKDTWTCEEFRFKDVEYSIDDGVGVYCRAIKFTNTGVEIGYAHTSGNATPINSECIPLEIIGYKY